MNRTGVASNVLVFLCVTLLVLASTGVLATQTRPTGQAATSTQISHLVANSTGTTSLGGLRLTLNVDPTAIYEGGAVMVSISDFNTLTTTNSLPIPGNRTLRGSGLSLGPCSQLPLGLGIYQGYYQAGNLSEGSPLNLMEPGIVWNCPAEFAVAYYSFAPQSYNVSLYSPQQSGSNQTTAAALMWSETDVATLNFSGYWTGQAGLLGNSTFNSFSPGLYTVVGENLWGEEVILHFQVLQESAPVSTTATAAPMETSALAGSLAGLQVRVSINATSITTGQSLQVDVSEFNTLNAVNNVTKSDQWQVPAALGPCPNLYDQPFGVAVYQGYYDAQNISQGAQIQIFPYVACPMFIRLITGYTFQPQSDLAVLKPGFGSVPVPLTGNVTVSEIYASPSQSRALTPGMYTIVAADEWGALAFLYFRVQ